MLTTTVRYTVHLESPWKVSSIQLCRPPDVLGVLRVHVPDTAPKITDLSALIRDWGAISRVCLIKVRNSQSSRSRRGSASPKALALVYT
jgi:hypothetical protein